MRIAGTLALCLATACAANRLTTPDAWRLTLPNALSVTTPRSAPLLAPDTHGLTVRLPTPKAWRCLDCTHVFRPYVMIIDGAAYRVPEDSARMRRVKQLQASDIESLEVIAGVVATERYHSGGRAVILIKTKRAAKRGKRRGSKPSRIG